MIKLIVGLGNPGQLYEKTRHNAGFLFLDRLVENCGCTWSKSASFQGLVAECFIAREKIQLLKPQTYMNRSGQAVSQMLRYFKLSTDQVLVVHDELDFAAGILRLKKNGGHAGHNGIRDIIAHLGASDFYRLRLGVGRPPEKMAVADYVLSTPSRQDEELIYHAIARGLGHLEKMITGDMGLIMNELNKQGLA